MLATTEVQQLLDEEGLSLALLPESDREVTAAGVAAEEQDGGVYRYPGGAGGYLEFIYRCRQGWDPGWLGLVAQICCAAHFASPRQWRRDRSVTGRADGVGALL